MDLLFELGDADLPKLFKPGNVNSFGIGFMFLLVVVMSETSVEVMVLLLAVTGGGEDVRERGTGLEFQGNSVPVFDAVTLDGGR